MARQFWSDGAAILHVLYQTVPVPGSRNGVWIQKLDRRYCYAAGSGCHHHGDGGLPGALHLVQRQGVCRDDPKGCIMGSAVRSGGHAHQLLGNDVNLGGW